MDAEEILARAREDAEPPSGWKVFPLLRDKLILGILGWIFGIIVGLGLFAAVATVVIPVNYEHGIVSTVFSTILLGVFLFVGLGSIWMLISDVQRLLHLKQHIIVITLDDFVKQEGKNIVRVPLVNVQFVTARGLPPPDRTPPEEQGVRQVPSAGENTVGFIMGRGLLPSGRRWLSRRRRTPTTLAFVDTRTDKEVIVATDKGYGDPFLIASFLKQYAASAQQLVR